MEENLELFDTLALLFPQRNWSYSVKELKKEPFYVQLKTLKSYSTFFEKSPELRKIVDFIGRREFDTPSNRIHYSPFGKNQIQTVRFSDSINNLLPIEAAKLLNPSLKKKFYADMLEGKLLSYQLLGKYYTGPPRIKPKGPMIVLVDTSGSMHGAPQTLAKSAVLAMAKRMLSQQRHESYPFCLDKPASGNRAQQPKKNVRKIPEFPFIYLWWRDGLQYCPCFRFEVPERKRLSGS